MNIINKSVSVIVPVYNVEKQIHHCIESLLNQSHSNLEILLINDGSEDMSGQICDDYARQDDRIRVIHQENKGISFVRNRGVQEISHEYFVFVDSDDYVSRHYVRNLLYLIEKSMVKIAACQYTKTLETNLDQNLQVEDKDFEVIDANQMLYRMLYHSGADFSLCDKMYHRSLFDEIQFPNGELYEDINVLPRLVKKAERVAVHYCIDYFNYLKENSIQRSKFNRKKLVLVENINQIYNEAVKNNEFEVMQAALYRKATILIELICQIEDEKDIPIKRELWNEFKQLRNSVILDKHSNARKAKGAAVISYLGLPIFEKIYNIYMKIR